CSADEEEICLDHTGKDGRTEVFVDHGFHTNQIAILFLHDGDTSTANSHDNEAIVDQAADGVCFNDSLGNWGGHNTAPTATSIFHHNPTIFLSFFHCQFFVHERTDRFCRILEGRVIGIDDCLGYNSCG